MFFKENNNHAKFTYIHKGISGVTVQYEWTIEDLKMTNVEVDGVAYTDVITEINWHLNAVESSESYYTKLMRGYDGSTSLDPNDIDADTFIEFADLGGVKIVEWAVAAINSEDANTVDQIKLWLATMLAEAQIPLVKKMKDMTTFNVIPDKYINKE